MGFVNAPDSEFDQVNESTSTGTLSASVGKFIVGHI